MTDADRDAVLHVHDEWWEANRDLDIPRMQACFAGERYHMFNLNGHTYRGLGEKTALWEALRSLELSIPDINQPLDLRVEVRGDVAWLSCEAVIRIVTPEPLPGLSTDPMRVRATEVFERDETGAWKIVHFHCSPHAPEDEERPPFGDTVASGPSAA